MIFDTIRVTSVAGTRRTGWRSVLREDSATAWRCSCFLPHSTPERAIECGSEALGRRSSGFYSGGYDMNDWLPVPQTDEERQALVEAIQSLPNSIDGSLDELHTQRALIMRADTYEDIRRLQGAAEGVKLMWRANHDVRQQYDVTFLTGEWRIGQELVREEAERGKASGVQMDGRDTLGRHREVRPNSLPTIAEKLGNRMYASRLRTIAPLAIEALNSAIKEAHRGGKEATLTGIVSILRKEESAMRRLDTLTTPAVEDGYTYRIGDSRVMLSDIADDSIPLILTDPPYGHDGEVLYEWLAEFAARVLVPGGSLICYTGQGLLRRDLQILSQHLDYRWTFAMMHAHSQKMYGATVFAKWKPVLWFTKGQRREPRTLIPDVVHARRDKSQHDWSQGDGGITQWIHHLTLPFETVLDPFAGTGDWGWIICNAGRYYIGCDVVAGGDTEAETGDIEVAEGEDDGTRPSC